MNDDQPRNPLDMYSYTKMDLMCCPKQSARIVEWILWGVLIQS